MFRYYFPILQSESIYRTGDIDHVDNVVLQDSCQSKGSSQTRSRDPRGKHDLEGGYINHPGSGEDLASLECKKRTT